MESKLRISMIFHGAAVVLLGMLAGFGYALVVTGAMAGETRAWSMAHAEGVQNGLLVLAIGAVGKRLSLTSAQARLCAWSFIVTGYANVAASIIGASTGNRGLALEAPFANIVVFSLFSVAIVTVFLGLGLVLLGARKQ